jgi:hypothetical protein
MRLIRKLWLRYALLNAQQDEAYYASAKATAEIRHRAAIKRQRVLRTALADMDYPRPKGVTA